MLRKKIILTNIKTKLMQRTQVQSQVEQRRTEKEKEKLQKAIIKQSKFAEADSRRSKILDEERKK